MAKKKNKLNTETTAETTTTNFIITEIPEVTPEVTPEVHDSVIIESPVAKVEEVEPSKEVESSKEDAKLPVKEPVKATTVIDHFNKKISAYNYFEIYYKGMCIYKAKSNVILVTKENALYVNNIPYPYNSIEIKY